MIEIVTSVSMSVEALRSQVGERNRILIGTDQSGRRRIIPPAEPEPSGCETINT